MKKEELYRFGVSMETSLINNFDKLISKKGYNNRSEAIRDLIRKEIEVEKVELQNEVVYGIISFMYNHKRRELEDKLTNIQHQYYKSIVSSTHIHIDAVNCLEVIIVNDKAKTLKKLSDSIFSLKGVQNGKLSLLGLV